MHSDFSMSMNCMNSSYLHHRSSVQGQETQVLHGQHKEIHEANLELRQIRLLSIHEGTDGQQATALLIACILQICQITDSIITPWR